MKNHFQDFFRIDLGGILPSFNPSSDLKATCEDFTEFFLKNVLDISINLLEDFSGSIISGILPSLRPRLDLKAICAFL